MLNAGLGFSDEFEIEVCNYHEKSSNKLKQQYREWKSTVKREGSALLKTVKNVVSQQFFILVNFTNIFICFVRVLSKIIK